MYWFLFKERQNDHILNLFPIWNIYGISIKIYAVKIRKKWMKGNNYLMASDFKIYVKCKEKICQRWNADFAFWLLSQSKEKPSAHNQK